MAKVHNPLLSFSAAGSVGPVCYCHGPDAGDTIHHVRRKPRGPSGPRSVGQQMQNERFRVASAAWETLDPAERLWWTNHGESWAKSGRLYFLAEYLNQWVQWPALPLQPVPRWTRA